MSEYAGGLKVEEEEEEEEELRLLYLGRVFFEGDDFDEETIVLLGSMCLEETQPMEEMQRKNKKKGVEE